MRVLIIDDDPSHLDLYRFIVSGAGYESVPLQVHFSGLEEVPEGEASAILLDYRLNSVKTAPEIAQELKRRFPATPIIVLSDLWSMPSDMMPHASDFVRKGDPRHLIATLRRYCPRDGTDEQCATSA